MLHIYIAIADWKKARIFDWLQKRNRYVNHAAVHRQEREIMVQDRVSRAVNGKTPADTAAMATVAVQHSRQKHQNGNSRSVHRYGSYL